MSSDEASVQIEEASGSSVEPDALPFLAELKGITKRFPGVVALDEVDFDLRAGEVHVLFGENGAGKSTLINIIAGTYPPDQGRFYFEGREVAHQSPYSARRAGISPVFQEFSLAPNLSVEENLFLGREQVRLGVLNKTRMHAEACEMLADLGFDLDANAIVGELMRAQQQMVEIAKALLQDVKLLILDEPTSSLTERETTRLFELIDRLKRERVGILYVSHRMSEIKQVGDRLTVLRDGKKIGTVEAAEVEETQLVEMMTGRTFDVLFPEIDHRPAEVLLNVKNLTLASGRLDDVSFSVHAGEIVGVAGLVGCGKSELARAVYGLEDIAAGEIVLEGAHISQPTPAMMLGRALTYFPSDRLAEGLSLPRPIRENISMAALDLPAFSRFRWLRRARERVEVGKLVKKLQIRPPQMERTIDFLSGGNRQKVMLARGLTRNTRVFLFDEPTVGIDVGAKSEVYELMKNLAESGAAVLLISSELPEVLNLANRVYVMRQGRIVAELAIGDLTEQAVLSWFFEHDNAAANSLEGIAPRMRKDDDCAGNR